MTALAVAVVIIAAVCLLACLIGDDTATVEPEQGPTDWLREPCDTTGCPCTGWIPATRRDDGRSVLVCAGDYADGELRGWWK